MNLNFLRILHINLIFQAHSLMVHFCVYKLICVMKRMPRHINMFMIHSRQKCSLLISIIEFSYLHTDIMLVLGTFSSKIMTKNHSFKSQLVFSDLSLMLLKESNKSGKITARQGQHF